METNNNQETTDNLNYITQIYKIFVFESNTGELLKTEDYVNFPDVQKEVLDYNRDHQDARWNLFIGVEFPPKGVRFDLTIKQFIAKSLSEKVADGEVYMPPETKIVNNTFVRMTKKELYEKGLLSLDYDEKIDDFDNIVKLSKKEIYELGKMTKYQVYEHFIQELNLKIESKLKSFYNYPMHEIGTWQLKSMQANNWLKLSPEEKNNYLIQNEFFGFDLIIAESALLTGDTKEQKIEKIDMLSNKIINKYKDLEKKYGETFAIKTNKKNELKTILDNNDEDVYNKMERVFLDMLI